MACKNMALQEHGPAGHGPAGHGLQEHGLQEHGLKEAGQPADKSACKSSLILRAPARGREMGTPAVVDQSLMVAVVDLETRFFARTR
jgi:hypothetical protein